MSGRWCVSGALVILSALVSCDSVSSPARPPSPNQMASGGLHLVVSITRTGAGSMAFRIGIENRGPATATLRFLCGQFFDIEVTGPSGGIAWRWSHDKAFTLAMWDLELPAGESYAQDASWDLAGNDGKPLPPGSYGCRVYITNTPPDGGLTFETSLTI